MLNVPLSHLGKDYARADARWGVADPTIVSMELITVIGTGATILYIMQKLVQDDPARHYWIIVLCTAELYGGCVSRAGHSVLSSLGVRRVSVTELAMALVG